MTTRPLRQATRRPVLSHAARDVGVGGGEWERRMLTQYRRHGDAEAREALIDRFLPLARDLARRFLHTGEGLDDLTQVAALGLVKAIDRFDPGRDTRFSSYAVPTMLGELRRHIRDKCWALHVPRGVQERVQAVGREREALESQLGRSPTPREVARALGCATEDVHEALEAAGCYVTASLDAPASGDDDWAGFGEQLGADDPAYARVEDRDLIAREWRHLDDLDRKILVLRFTLELSQREIADQIGYSQIHVSRLLRRALDRLSVRAAA
jgi:RNA polymerase sigma-B factor